MYAARLKQLNKQFEIYRRLAVIGPGKPMTAEEAQKWHQAVMHEIARIEIAILKLRLSR